MTGFDTTMRHHAIPLALILLAATLPYMNSLSNEFVWDDRPLIVEDFHIRSARFLGDIFTRDFFSHSEDELKYGYYRPLITLSYMTDYALWGLNPAGFRLTNILFHAACSVLVYLLALRLLGGRTPAAFAAGLLFAAHPIHTESVTWIAGRTDVICAFFMLSSLYAFLAGSSWKSRLLSQVLFALALLAKEMALALPFIVWLCARLVAGRPRNVATRTAAPYLLIAGAYLLWRSLAAHVAYSPARFGGDGIYVLSLAKTFWLYVYKLLWPVPLTAYIQNPNVLDPFDQLSLVALLLTLMFVLVLWQLYGRRTQLLFVLGAFLLSLLPLANIVRISAPFDMGFPMAERFLYLPSAFFLMAAAWLLVDLVPFPRAVIVLVLLVAAADGVRAAIRNADWQDERVFFERALKQAPDAPLLHASLGRVYARDGQYARAVAEMEEALKLNRYQVGVSADAILNNLAATYVLAGENGKAMPILRKLIGGGKPLAAYYYNAGRCMLMAGDALGARQTFEKALALRPNYLDALIGRAEAREALGDYAAAAEDYRSALRLYPGTPELHLALGVALKNTGRLPEALREYEAALAAEPGLAAARGNMGVAYAMLDDLPAARANLEAAVAADPQLWDAQNALGMVYAKQGDPGAARAKFEYILSQAPTNTDAILNEGILFYQAGDKTKARAQFQRVLSLNPDDARAAAFLKKLGGK